MTTLFVWLGVLFFIYLFVFSMVSEDKVVALLHFLIQKRLKEYQVL